MTDWVTPRKSGDATIWGTRPDGNGGIRVRLFVNLQVKSSQDSADSLGEQFVRDTVRYPNFVSEFWVSEEVRAQMNFPTASTPDGNIQVQRVGSEYRIKVSPSIIDFDPQDPGMFHVVVPTGVKPLTQDELVRLPEKWEAPLERWREMGVNFLPADPQLRAELFAAIAQQIRENQQSVPLNEQQVKDIARNMFKVFKVPPEEQIDCAKLEHDSRLRGSATLGTYLLAAHVTPAAEEFRRLSQMGLHITAVSKAGVTYLGVVLVVNGDKTFEMQPERQQAMLQSWYQAAVGDEPPAWLARGTCR